MEMAAKAKEAADAAGEVLRYVGVVNLQAKKCSVSASHFTSIIVAAEAVD